MRQTFSVIGDAEGDSTDAYTYSGNLRVVGPERVWDGHHCNADKRHIRQRADGDIYGRVGRRVKGGGSPRSPL